MLAMWLHRQLGIFPNCLRMYRYLHCVLPIGESATAVQHVLRCMGYDASDSKSISDTFLLEMQSDEVQWTKAGLHTYHVFVTHCLPSSCRVLQTSP